MQKTQMAAKSSHLIIVDFLYFFLPAALLDDIHYKSHTDENEKNNVNNLNAQDGQHGQSEKYK